MAITDILMIVAKTLWVLYLAGLPLWFLCATLGRWRKELAEFRQQQRDEWAIRNGFVIRDDYPPKVVM